MYIFIYIYMYILCIKISHSQCAAIVVDLFLMN